MTQHLSSNRDQNCSNNSNRLLSISGHRTIKLPHKVRLVSLPHRVNGFATCSSNPLSNRKSSLDRSSIVNVPSIGNGLARDPLYHEWRRIANSSSFLWIVMHLGSLFPTIRSIERGMRALTSMGYLLSWIHTTQIGKKRVRIDRWRGDIK